MICPNCKTKYSNEFKVCPDCGAELLPEEIEQKELCSPDKEPKTDAYKKKFWLAFTITLVSAVFFGFGMIAGLLCCVITWLFQLREKEEGAHGWIVGALAAFSIGLFVLGACFSMLFM